MLITSISFATSIEGVDSTTAEGIAITSIDGIGIANGSSPAPTYAWGNEEPITFLEPAILDTDYSNNDSADLWRDISAGTTIDAIQDNGSLAPTVRTDQINGYTALYFDGTEEMEIGIASQIELTKIFHDGTELAIYYVAKFLNGDTEPFISGYNGDGATLFRNPGMPNRAIIYRTVPPGPDNAG